MSMVVWLIELVKSDTVQNYKVLIETLAHSLWIL